MIRRHSRDGHHQDGRFWRQHFQDGEASAEVYHWEALAPPQDSAGAGAAAVCAAQSVLSWAADQSSVTLKSINY